MIYEKLFVIVKIDVNTSIYIKITVIKVFL